MVELDKSKYTMEYTVVIRTLGTAGEKYQALLDSIAKQTIQPKEVIVVIPHGYDLPKEQLGYERFVRSKKGMVAQRVVGAAEVKTDYCLFADDDVCFEENFISRIFEPIAKCKASVTFPIFKEMLPMGLSVRMAMLLIGSAIPFERKQSFTSITRSGGYSYNPSSTFKGYYKAESAPGTCFFCSRDAMLAIHFEEELWLENTAYPIPEDQVMFYKFCKLGYKIIGVSDLNFIHLDAGGNSPGRFLKVAYAMACNKTIFWHRFIWATDSNILSKLLSLLCFLYCATASFLYDCTKALLSKNFDLVKSVLKGYKQAIGFIKSDEYKQIPRIKK